jgi:hypothetical protein
MPNSFSSTKIKIIYKKKQVMVDLSLHIGLIITS